MCIQPEQVADPIGVTCNYLDGLRFLFEALDKISIFFSKNCKMFHVFGHKIKTKPEINNLRHRFLQKSP